MPVMNGYETCRRLKESSKTRSIPIIFLTSLATEDEKTRGFDLGAVDYITKPYHPGEVKARVHTHVNLKRSRDQLARQNLDLERMVEERTQEVLLTQAVTIESLATLAETRDNETGSHIRRTQHYVRTLAERLRSLSRFHDSLTTEILTLIYRSAPLHDIGKVGIPDRILLKPGPLTTEEFEVMKRHTIIGRDALLKAERGLGTSSFLRTAREIAESHHERWDGGGYPNGTKEDKIPLSARIMTVADVYDALVNKRVYKSAGTHEDAVSEILAGAGTHFDPDIAQTIRTVEERFRDIARQYADDA
jgi:putative two-component system response regulator